MGVTLKKNFYFRSKTKYAHFSADIHSFSKLFFLNERSHLDYYLDAKIRFREKIVNLKVYGNLKMSLNSCLVFENNKVASQNTCNKFEWFVHNSCGF